MGAAILEFTGYAGDHVIHNLPRLNELIIMIYTRHPHANEQGPNRGTVGPFLGRLSERARRGTALAGLKQKAMEKLGMGRY